MAKPNIRLRPPSFAPNAKPTPRGWVDPKTGELLVAVKLDMANFEKPKEEVKEEPKEELKEEVKEEPKEAPKEEPKEPSEAPKRRVRRTRSSKKNDNS